MKKSMLFISHIAKETDLAQCLKKFLVNDFLGILEVFVSSDGKTIQAGEPWLNKLSEALERAKFEIVLCSKESVARPWVNFEAGAGWVRGIRVMPVCHSGLIPDHLPMPLNLLQGIEAGRPEGLQQLYEAIAGLLEVQVPRVDFKTMAQEVEALEEKYRLSGQDLERIDHPRILCAASEQYADHMKFDVDVAVLEGIFPGQVVIERRLTSDRLRRLLTTQTFDIVHLVLPVDPESGDLLFSPVGSGHNPSTPKVDKMLPEFFATLLVESKTRLVVLATCYALYLAVEVARIANMIATKAIVNGEQMAEWSECFYGLLANGYSVYKAHGITESNRSLVPMKLLRQKDVAFSLAAKSAGE